MVEIVMHILRDLQHLRSTDAMMKQQLTLLLGEEVAQIAWARLGAWRREEKLDLRRVQDALDASTAQSECFSLLLLPQSTWAKRPSTSQWPSPTRTQSR